MSDYLKNKNVLGELSFGEFWNAFGCHAACAKIEGIRGVFFDLFVEDEVVVFCMPSSDGPTGCGDMKIRVLLKASAIVAGNRVSTSDWTGKKRVISFFELKPMDCGLV